MSGIPADDPALGHAEGGDCRGVSRSRMNCARWRRRRASAGPAVVRSHELNANEPLKQLCLECADKEKVALNIDFITVAGSGLRFRCGGQRQLVAVRGETL